MPKQPPLTLVGIVLALTVLGCRNEHRYDSDETNPPYPATPSGEQQPPLVEDDDAIGEHDRPEDDQDRRDETWDSDRDEDQLEVPPPEARDSNAPIHQPPPSGHETQG